jgi:hypothetical protein
MRYDIIYRPVTVMEAIKFRQFARSGDVDYDWLVSFVASRIAPPGASRDELMAMPVNEFHELLGRILNPTTVPSVFGGEGSDGT